MKIIFTICSNNYLAQAKVLYNSVLQNCTNAKFVLVLVDTKHPNIEYGQLFPQADIYLIHEIAIPNFEFISKNYDIIELNTAVKPTVFKFLVNSYTQAEQLYYFDPDIKIYNDLTALSEKLAQTSYVLTPHILSPLAVDNLYPNENTFLNFGVFNLGFIGINPQKQIAHELLDWWEERTTKIGYNDPINGMFVDQLWFNIAVFLFKDYIVIEDKGCNFAPWNFHERLDLTHRDDKYIFDDKSMLTFLHFSNIDFGNPVNKTNYYDRFKQQADNPILTSLYEGYFDELKLNGYQEFKKIKCHYKGLNKKKIYLKLSIPIWILDMYKKIVK
jgi:hypothetical protein